MKKFSQFFFSWTLCQLFFTSEYRIHSNIRLMIFILSWAVVAIFSLLWSAIGRISLINKHFCKRKQKEVRRTTGSLGYLFLRYCRDTLRTRRVAIQGGRASTQLAGWAWRTNDREVSRRGCKVWHFRAIAKVSETETPFSMVVTLKLYFYKNKMLKLAFQIQEQSIMMSYKEYEIQKLMSFCR